MNGTNRTTAELREAIADAILRVNGNDCTFRESEKYEPATFQWCVEITDAIFELLPQPPALGGIVEEIDGLFEKATAGPAAMSGVRSALSPSNEKSFRVYSEATQENLAYFPTGMREEEMIHARSDARLYVALKNAWPTLRANLKQEEWQDMARQAERLIWNYAMANVPTEPEYKAAGKLCEQLRSFSTPSQSKKEG